MIPELHFKEEFSNSVKHELRNPVILISHTKYVRKPAEKNLPIGRQVLPCIKTLRIASRDTICYIPPSSKHSN